MVNYMAEVAKMLGVELGELFEIYGYGGSYCLLYNGLFNQHSGYEAIVLSKLLSGDCEINRKPWKPKYNEDYWAVTAIDGVLAHNTWKDCWMDITYYKLGNCYRTCAEAEANRDKWITFYASDEVLEVNHE